MKFVAVSALSHDGLVREHNEDSLVAGPFTLCAITTLTPQTLWFPVDDPVVVAVADGLGGHPAGEEASALAVRWLAHAAANLTTEAAVRDALLACNEAVYADADRDPERLTMGTTIAGVAVTDESVIVFNVGDSRVYRFDESGLVQLSVDDNEPPARGQIRSPILTQTLGGSWEVAPIRPHLVTQPLGDPARYLICSDGLTDAISDSAITAVLRDHEGGRPSNCGRPRSPPVPPTTSPSHCSTSRSASRLTLTSARRVREMFACPVVAPTRYPYRCRGGR